MVVTWFVHGVIWATTPSSGAPSGTPTRLAGAVPKPFRAEAG